MTLQSFDNTASATLIAEAIRHKDIWDIITSIGILLAGLGGLKILFEYTSIRKLGLALKIQKLKREYPINKIGITYYIWKSKYEDAIWLIDLRKKVRRHIANPETNREMGWRDKYKEVSKEKIESYAIGDKINTKSLNN